MFLRFAIKQIDEDSRKPLGVLNAAYDLLDSYALDSVDAQRVRELLEWFSENLPAPPDEFSANRAIFWFKSNADESISRIWELVHLLSSHGHHIDVYKTRHLANVAYEDDYQIAAYPSDRDGRITVQ